MFGRKRNEDEWDEFARNWPPTRNPEVNFRKIAEDITSRFGEVAGVEALAKINALATHLGLEWKEESTIPAHWEKTSKKQPQ